MRQGLGGLGSFEAVPLFTASKNRSEAEPGKARPAPKKNSKS